MALNGVTLNPGVGGSTVATDVIAGKEYQLVKIVLGTIGVDDDPLSTSNQMPVIVKAVPVTNRSGTIIAANTAQTLMIANSSRSGWYIRNNSSTASIYYSETETAVIGYMSLELRPGEYFESSPTWCTNQAISIICATAGVTFTAREA